jgi:hypothetical protein
LLPFDAQSCEVAREFRVGKVCSKWLVVQKVMQQDLSGEHFPPGHGLIDLRTFRSARQMSIFG